MDRLRGKIPDMTFRPLLAAAAFAAALPALSALTALAAPNPCSTVTPVELTGAEEAAYIAKKTAEVFKVSPKLQATPSATAAAYAVPDGWRRELLAFDAVPVEKYERATLFLHGGGYLGGLHDRCRSWGLYLADVMEARTDWELDYRTAPAHRHPAASPTRSPRTRGSSRPAWIRPGPSSSATPRAAGVNAELKIYPGMSHDWTSLLPELPVSRAVEAVGSG